MTRDEWGPEQSPSAGRWALYVIPVVTLTLLASPANKLVLIIYPFLAFITAVYLYRRNLSHYVTLLCWLWFLTPLVRRILDYRAGWEQPTAVLLGPPLAACVPLIWLIADWRKVVRGQGMAPLLCIAATFVYATFMGLFTFTPRLVFQDLLTWFAPMTFTLFLCRHRDRIDEIFQAFEKAFVYGLLVISVYGLVQFFFLPGWDRFWMTWVNMDSIGKPLPTEVRVFSTMNGPQILASFLATGLILAFSSHRRIRFVAIPLGLICLSLSLARSGWVAMVAGTFYLLCTLPQKQRFRLVLAGLVAAIAMIAALQNPDVQDVMSVRFETFTDVRNDTSFLDRFSAYQSLFASFMDNPFGLGMGATPAIAEATTRMVAHGGWEQDLGDSTIAMVMTTMGLAGTLILVFTFVPLGRNLFFAASADPHSVHVMRAVLFAMMAEAPLDGVVSGPTGFLTWASIGFCIALSLPSERGLPQLQPTRSTA